VFEPIYMLLHPFGRFTCCYTLLADLHVIYMLHPFGRFTCCYTIYIWPIYMLLHPFGDSFALHALHLFPTLLPCMQLHLMPQFRPNYLLIHLLLSFLLAIFLAFLPFLHMATLLFCQDFRHFSKITLCSLCPTRAASSLLNSTSTTF
jgi:hypothetical protein